VSQFTEMRLAVSRAMAITLGLRNALITAPVTPCHQTISPTTGIDHKMRCGTTSSAGMCAIAFM
jgi:hypothetical protein